MGFKLDVERKERFFAVTTPLRINGKRYTPSVCYPLTEDIDGARRHGLVVDRQRARVEWSGDQRSGARGSASAPA